MHVRPFAALRPVPEAAASIAALPYDVVSADEARAMVCEQPLSFLAVDLPETFFEPGHDPYAPEVYSAAAEAFERYAEDGLVEKDAGPHFYVYRLDDAHASMTGLACLVDAADYESGVIKRHENTRRAKEDDRVRHIQALDAQTGPVFLAFRDQGDGSALREAVQAAASGEPLYDFTDAQGTRNRLWRVDDPAAAQALAQGADLLPCAYIADGHHRSASAARVAAERGGEAAGLMAVLFPASQLAILPYNRVVADTNGLSAEQLLQALADAGFVAQKAAGPVRPAAPGTFGLVTGGEWYALSFSPELAEQVARLAPEDALDVAVLQDRVLGPILGIGDPREDPRIDFVGGVRGLDELAARAGDRGVGIACYATGIDQLMAVADAGALMPPKSTWFEPKLRSGLLFHQI